MHGSSMTHDESIVELGAWLRTPAGQVLMRWEQASLDQGVSDAFGFHALQLGLPEIDALRANRMPHRWVATDSMLATGADTVSPPPEGVSTQAVDGGPVQLVCGFDALPFPAGSLDLLVLPHTLELTEDPHLTLREVERVLMPEGRVLITGFNPVSLWAMRQRAGRACRQLGRRRGLPLYLPRAGEFIGYWRLRDWLRLLGFELEAGHFGCYRAPCRTERWLERYRWMDGVGERWWPVLGAAYYLSAVKRVRGMRLVGLARQDRQAVRAARAAVTQRRPEPVALESQGRDPG
jgi:SAM-dependent methyltransferase